MKLYLAGGVQGNLKPMWTEVCNKIKAGEKYETAVLNALKIFLAGQNGRTSIIKDIMDNKNLPFEVPESIINHRPYILESFYYMDKETEELLPFFGDFMLDSGAFTFCGNVGFDLLKFDEYTEKYVEFIKRNKIKKYFELDIDSIVGYDKVKTYRKRIELMTGEQSIPVWHIERGKEEFIRHCDEYPYVALGGYVAAIKTSDPRQKLYTKMYPWFIKEAHKRGCKIHGLGYTSFSGLGRNHFDSVDSTAWITGNRFGYLYYFDGKTMKKKEAPEGYRLKNPRHVAINNFVEWIKYQKYAEAHL